MDKDTVLEELERQEEEGADIPFHTNELVDPVTVSDRKCGCPYIGNHPSMISQGSYTLSHTVLSMPVSTD